MKSYTKPMYHQLHELVNNTDNTKYAIFNVAINMFEYVNLDKEQASKLCTGMNQTILKY
jgi:hypothetical protein